MSTATQLTPNPKDTKYIDFYPRFRKERKYFDQERTANGRPWPYVKQPDELYYDNFLADVVDPSTGDYYADNDTGKPAGKYVVDMIIRYQLVDGSEVLLTQGKVEALDYFRHPKTFSADKPEMHKKTLFRHDTRLDSRNRVTSVCKGPQGSEFVYDLPFTPENLDKLWSLKRHGNIQLIVKTELNSEPHALERKGLLRPNDIQGSYDLFKNAEFDYLYNWEYTKEQPNKKLPYLSQEDIDEIKRAQPDTKSKVNLKEPEKVK